MYIDERTLALSGGMDAKEALTEKLTPSIPRLIPQAQLMEYPYAKKKVLGTNWSKS